MQEKNKRKRAVALKYDLENEDAPTISASGQGVVADKIIEKADESDIAIYEDERLVKELLQFKVGTEIPPELYDIVAQILVFVESIDDKKGKSRYHKYY